MDARLLSQLEQQYGIQPGLLNAVMMQESGGNPNAVSPKGAKGWFQFMPPTAAQYGVTDPTDFKQSATGAARYLSNLYKEFGNWEDALRGYNWGEGNLRKFKTGKRKDMPPEAQAYPGAVLARLDSAPPALPDDEDVAPDLPPELPDEEAPAPKSTARDYQAELEARAGTVLLPTLGGVAGGIMGGVAGAPTVVGAIPGSAAGGLAGAMLGHATAIATADVPIEEKLEYLKKKAGVEGVMNLLGVKGANALTQMLAKTPADRIAIQQWMERQGSNIHPITDRQLSPRATGVYRQAEQDIGTTIDVAIGKTLQDIAAGGGTPTGAGRVFQQAYKAANTAVSQEHDVIFSPFRHGTPFGNMPTKPSAALQQKAGEIVQNFKDTKITEADAGASASVLKMVKDIAAGVEVPLATMVAQKRALGNTANWDAVKGTVDNSIRKDLTRLLDETIEAKLATLGSGPKAQWQSANARASRSLDILNDKMIMRLAGSDKVDPMEVTEYVAKNATPATITSYKKAMKLMVDKGAITPEQNEYLMNHVRRNWIEQNMNNHKKAADIYEAILGTGKNAEAVDSFNAVFGQSPYRSILEETAKAAHALRKFSDNIPRAAGGPGEYATAGAAGGLAFGKIGAALATGGAYMMNAIPKLVAKAQLRNDSAMRNKIRFLVNYVNQASPDELKNFAKGSLTMMPANVQRVYGELQSELGD